ncbi:hypothetical protein [Streptomyces sp. NBC_00878]|uniref:hypothetical protein n=1 Tax=Streptomyces sp. NBC_00878 TaxID=2975854 RepID=UPI0022590D6A|nr:hypothetical protein [Streptomyces sp. NBC_00878]MCX4911824.1 hypothetical protein [Streptomyces sp. NBC_00878]
MTTHLPSTPAPQPVTDDEARMRAFQIVGSDIDHTWTGDWHEALKTFAAKCTPDQPAT